jgi:nanoRNase/pAp phosphatase (c-di-AMP/oligoRNAs hydrolase)
MISQRTQQRFRELAESIEAWGDGRWLVMSHDNPDPDALVSMAILGQILKRRFRRKVTIAYGGIIGRAENQEMCRSLGLHFSRLRHINLKHYRHFALVDTQPGTGNNQLPATLSARLVMDHHPVRKGSRQASFADIRPDYGATASIAAEYLLSSGLPITKAAATGLVYAIHSETLSFSRESPGPDRVLYDHFYPLATKRTLGRIQFPRVPLAYFRTLSNALTSLEAVDNVIVCHLDSVDTPDSVPEIADLLLRLEGKTWCLATGPHEDRIYLSIRTTNTRANAGAAMRRILGRKGKGGGHSMIAGGWYPLNGRSEDTNRVQRHLTEKLLRILRKEPARLERLVLE